MHHITRSLRILVACAAAALLVSAPAAAQDDLEDWQRAELRAMLEAIQAGIDGRVVPVSEPFGFRPDFLKGTDGNAYVPFTLSVDPARVDTPTLAMYLYVVEPGGEDAVFEDAFFANAASGGGGEPIRISRAFAVPGGAYDVYVVLRESDEDLAPDDNRPGDRDREQIDAYCAEQFPEDLSMHFACQEQEYRAYRLQRRPRLSFDENEQRATTMMLRTRVDVPDFWNDQLQLSSIILPEVVEPLSAPLTPEEQVLSPYSLGTTRIVPKFDQDFGRQVDLSLIFLVYNPGFADGSKPDITVEYAFYRQGDGREEYFNRTNPQQFNGQTLPPDFDLEFGHQIVAGQTVPLSLFPAGDYRMEVRVTDLARVVDGLAEDAATAVRNNMSENQGATEGLTEGLDEESVSVVDRNMQTASLIRNVPFSVHETSEQATDRVQRRRGGASSIPVDVMNTIRSTCEERWPADFAMQRFCQENQIEGYLNLR